MGNKPSAPVVAAAPAAPQAPQQELFVDPGPPAGPIVPQEPEILYAEDPEAMAAMPPQLLLKMILMSSWNNLQARNKPKLPSFRQAMNLQHPRLKKISLPTPAMNQ